MKTDKITVNQAMFSIILFNIGSSVVLGINTGAGQDAWIALLAGALMALPIYLIYSRLIELFPQQNLFQMAEALFGRAGGCAAALLFTWYALHLASLVLRDFSEFTEISSMPETPQLPIMLLMALATVYLARSGMRTIGKWAIIATPFALAVVLFTFCASLGRMKVEALLPIFSHPVRLLAHSSFQIFSFPFGETVLFLCLGDWFERDSRPFRMWGGGLAVVLVTFLLVFLRNITLLGRMLANITYFPSYVAVRLIEVGDFLTRIEGSISSNFTLAGILKISVCLLACSRGLAHLFGLKDHRLLVFPMGMAAVALGTLSFGSIMELFGFTEYYCFYAFPFQVIIPLVLWVAGEIRLKKLAQPAQESG